jgi:ABC-type nickel/cobalt efflux system permease component RcnA
MTEATTGHHHLPDFHAIREWASKRRAHAPDNPGPPKQTLNRRIAVMITDVVGTMWCAYAFALLAMVSLPQAYASGTAPLIAWIAQTFLQLVLLSIIMVGQKVASEASDRQAYQTYKDAEAILHISDQLQELITLNNKLTEEIHQAISLGKRKSDQPSPS